METPNKEDIIDAAQILVIGRYAKEVLREAKEDLINQGKKELLWKALRGIEISQSLARYFLVTTALFYGLPETIEIKSYCAQRAAILVQDLFEFTIGIKYMKCYKNLPDSIKRTIVENGAVFIRQFKSQIIDAIPDVAPGVGFLVMNIMFPPYKKIFDDLFDDEDMFLKEAEEVAKIYKDICEQVSRKLLKESEKDLENLINAIDEGLKIIFDMKVLSADENLPTILSDLEILTQKLEYLKSNLRGVISPTNRFPERDKKKYSGTTGGDR